MLFAHLLTLYFGVYLLTAIIVAALIFCCTLQLFYLYIVRENRQKQETLISMIDCMVSAIDAKDPITAGHSQRVSEISALIAEKKGLSKRDVDNIRFAGLIHDIGKIGIPDAVLNKPRKFTPEEYDKIKEHPEKGIKIMERAGLQEMILSGIKDHHERPDGKGYPSGKKAGEISLCAEIIKIADVYDALISARQYKEGWPIEKVCNILYEGKGTEFNAELIDLFLKEIQPKDWFPPDRNSRDNSMN